MSLLEVPRVFSRVIGIKVDPDDHQPVRTQLLPVLFLEMRSLRIARSSRVAEEVQQDDPAPISVESLLSTVQPLQPEVGRPAALQSLHQRLHV